MDSQHDDYLVRINETVVGRKAGGSAREKARELQAERPVASLVNRVLRRRTTERAWRKGAFGERFNGWLLDRLPRGWHVFHDVPVGNRGANIDHIVIGPAGVFTVNTKNVKGSVWLAPRTLLLNGHRTDWLPKAVREARRASRSLSAALGRPVTVTGVLAVLADDWTIKEVPGDVHVGTPRGVKKWLLSLPTALSTGEVMEICAAAAKPSTWVEPQRGAKPGMRAHPHER